jgi:RNA polymerase sigma factor (sigma-70 family)
MATATTHPLIHHIRRLAGARPAADLSDAHLLARFAADGDAAAFEALMRRHGPLVLGVCRRVLGDRHAAEDAFQEVFALLVRKAGSLREPEGVGPWLFGVAYRTARTARGRAARRGACERKAARPPAVEPSGDLVWRDLRPVLDDAVARLPKKHREPFVLHYLQGVPVDDVAGRLGWPRGTVAARLARAREQLRKGLVRQGVTLSGAALAEALSVGAVSGAVPPRLLAAAVRAAAAILTGPTAFTGVAAGGTAFGKGGLKPMFTMNWKGLVIVLLAVALAGAGASLLTPGARADRQEGRGPASAARPAPPAPAGAEKRSVVEKKYRQYQVELLLAQADPGGRDLGRHGKAKVLAQPRLQTLEGRESVFQSGGDVVVPADERGMIEYLPVGLTVRVKVARLKDGRLRLDAALEWSEGEVSGKAGWRMRRFVVEAIERVKLGEEVKLEEKDSAGRLQHWALLRVVREESVESRTESREPEEAAAKGKAKPAYVIGPPDVLQIDSADGLLGKPLHGPHLVRPDGTVGLGTYGSASVAGLTIEQARVAIAKVISANPGPRGKAFKEVVQGLSVDVLAYNSRAYYVITDLAGQGEQVYRFPVTGNETVLDAVAQVKSLAAAASRCRVWLARPASSSGGRAQMLRVDWAAITREGQDRTNYQLLPGDRLYVKEAGK